MKLKGKKIKGIVIGVLVIAVITLVIPLIGGSKVNHTYLETTAKVQTMETYYSFAGNVTSTNIKNVMAETMMQVKEVKVEEGENVSEEDVLFIATDGRKVKAGIDGTVNKLVVEEGQQVMSGAMLCEIIDFDNLELQIKVDEYDLECVEVGKEILVNIGAIDKNIKATVEEVSRTAMSQNGVAYFTATLSLETDKDIRLGMSAETRILDEKAEDVTTILTKAIEFDEENKPFVYVEKETGKGNTKEKQYIETGITDGIYAEVTAGLSDGQTIFYVDTAVVKSGRPGFLPPM